MMPCKAKIVREYALTYSKKECIVIEKEWINNPQGGLCGFFLFDKLITIAIRVTPPAALLQGFSMNKE